ncbi:MAG: hypothetical protein KF751_11225 [Nitrospira sp.]|nr:hypothetical protein [Nitrospira sp.]
MDIRYLVDCQQVIPQVAQWLFDEWGRFLPDSSVEGGVSRLHKRLHRDQLPLTLMAMEAGVAIGTISLIHCDMETRPDLSP